MGEAVGQEEWNIQIKVKPTQGRDDLMAHPVFHLDYAKMLEQGPDEATNFYDHPHILCRL